MDNYNHEIIDQVLQKSQLFEIMFKDNISEICINKPHEIYFLNESHQWIKVVDNELTYEYLYDVAVLLTNYHDSQYPISFTNPQCSITTHNNYRCQIIVPPISKSGMISFTFRKPSESRFSIDDYQKSGRFENAKVVEIEYKSDFSETLSEEDQILNELLNTRQFDLFFKKCIEFDKNIVTSGKTGSGKTTFMKALIDDYDPSLRLVVIQDVHELEILKQPNHTYQFFSKERSAVQCLENSLRMRPDKIILSEIRGDESWSYLSALNVGHPGSITSIHANNSMSVINRLCSLTKQSPVGLGLDYSMIKDTVFNLVDVVVHLDKTYIKEIYFKNRSASNE